MGGFWVSGMEQCKSRMEFRGLTIVFIIIIMIIVITLESTYIYYLSHIQSSSVHHSTPCVDSGVVDNIL